MSATPIGGTARDGAVRVLGSIPVSKPESESKSNRPRRNVGRPTIRTKALVARILRRMSNGEILSRICREDGMPDRGTVWRWTEEDPEFRDALTRAREACAHALTDEAVEIADDGTNDYVEVETRSGGMKTVLDKEHVDRSKLRVETRKWLAGCVAPKAYGQRTAHEVSGPNGAPLVTVVDLVRGLTPPTPKP